MKGYGEILLTALNELKEVLPSLIENAKIAPFLNIHEDGE